MTRELFVYWHVAEQQAAAAENAARQLQRSLCQAQPALVARLYRRAVGERSTLMETYALPDSGVDEALQQHIEAAAAQTLAPWCADGRHVEVFENCSR